MAPIDFNDRINIISMVGTWIGTLCTMIGLAAVFAQLRSLLRSLRNNQTEIYEVAAGDWAPLLPKLKTLENGIVEGKVPTLRAWIYYYYDNDKSIAVCPYQNRDQKHARSGQSGWSQLLGRLDILAKDIVQPGHRDNYLGSFFPRSHSFSDDTGDIMVVGSKISYGLSSRDFIVLLILSSFSPSKFDAKKTITLSSHLGNMYFAAHTDPFSQIAELEGYTWNAQQTYEGSSWEGRHADHINVRHAIDLALGILRFEKPGDKTLYTLLFCTGDEDSDEETSHEHLWPRPSPESQLLRRRNLTTLTGGSKLYNDLYDPVANAYPDFTKSFGGHRFAWRKTPFDMGLKPFQVNSIFEVAFGLSALKPWGLLPVIPKSIGHAFCPHLEEFLDSQPKATNIMLVDQFTALTLPPQTQHILPHRRVHGIDGMKAVIGELASVRTRHFQGLSPYCSLYYDAMIAVFESHGLELRQVQISLAAYCATNHAISIALSYKQTDQQRAKINHPDWQVGFRAFVRECLHGSPVDEVKPWACEILALYLHAWLLEAKDMKENFRECFRKRVFLG